MRPSRIVALAVAVALFIGWAPPALAWPGYYANECSGCHDSAVTTCHGCHSHGAQQNSAKNAIGIAGLLDKDAYAPGDMVTVTVTGGYEPGMFETGWLRIVLLDDLMNPIVDNGSRDYPITLTTAAPSTGPHTWAIAWYGNAGRDIDGGHSLGSGTSDTLKPGYFTLDTSPDRPDHGWQTVALPGFTVSESDSGTPDAGTQDAGTPDAGTPDGGSVGGGIADAGPGAGTDGGTGTGTTTGPSSGGCGSGGSASAAALVLLALLAVRQLRRRLAS
jgi:uncharacterized protein (TIGR03382 family)